MVRFDLYLTKQQVAALRKLAQSGLSVAEHIRRAIDQYLERLNK